MTLNESQDVQRRLADIGDDLRDAAIGAVEDIADAVFQEAQANLDRAGIGDGNLAHSLAVEAGLRVTERHVVAAADYARFVEFGTRKMAARPFLGSALEYMRLRASTVFGHRLGPGRSDVRGGET